MKKELRMIIAGLALALTLPTISYSATLSVPSAFPKIQDAINVAVTGDVVEVDDGVYSGPGNRNISTLGKAITVRSKNGPANCVIDPQSLGAGFYIDKRETRSTVIKGFTIKNAYTDFGGAFYLGWSSPTIIGNILTGNHQSGGGFGAAIGGNGSSPWIEGNLITDNSADTQFLSGAVSFVNMSSPVIINNVIANNSCRGINMTLPEGTMPFVKFNTIVNNTTGVRINGQIDLSKQVYDANILAFNDVGLEIEFYRGLNPQWTNNLTFNDVNYVGIASQDNIGGNFTADPLFVNSTAGDYHVMSTSPAIGVVVGNFVSYDFDGTARGVSGVATIGAYEYVHVPTITVCVKLRNGVVNRGMMNISAPRKRDIRKIVVLDENDCYQLDTDMKGKFELQLTGKLQ